RVRCLLLSRHGYHRDLHSFPTRRSSDLVVGVTGSLSHAADLSGHTVGNSLACSVVLGAVDTQARGQTLNCSAQGVLRLGQVILRSEEHTSELQSRENLVCRLLLEKKKRN